MKFPRKGLSYYETYDSVSSESIGLGYYVKIEITETGVPDFLRDATAELALWLIGEDTTAPSGTENFSRIKVDTIDIQMKPKESARWFNKAVQSLVWHFLLSASPFNAPTKRVG
jgi:hypothetical protein